MITHAQIGSKLMKLFFKKVHTFENFTYQVYTYIENLYNEIKNDAIFPHLVCAILVSFFLLSTDTCKNIGCLKIYKARSRKASIFFRTYIPLKLSTAGWKDC